MNDGVTDWFSGLATYAGFAYFMLGFASSYVFHCVREWKRRRKVRLPWHIVGIVIGVGVILVVSLQTSQAYRLAKQTAIEVQQCQAEFNSTLRERSKISDENDEWSRVQRTAVGDWLRELLFPPPEIARIRADNPDYNSDPVYTKWGIDLTTKYSNIIQKAQLEQDANIEERKLHPLPEPTCGNMK